jgi:hypothetical protein
VAVEDDADAYDVDPGPAQQFEDAGGAGWFAPVVGGGVGRF